MNLDKKMNKPTRANINRLNKAIESVARHLDRLETIAIKNRCPIRGVYYTNSPKTEYSHFRVVYRKA